MAELTSAGHDVLSASRSSGVDVLTGAGLASALAGREVIVDATAPRSDALEFFTRSTRALIEHGSGAGVRHHLVLSVAGADRMPDSAYMRAKVAQENLVRESGIPFSIVRATQFHDFVATFPDVFADGDVVRVPAALIQPVSVDDVARIVADIATSPALSGSIDVGGPEAMTFAEAINRVAPERRVVADADVTYFGAALQDDTLLVREPARIGSERLRVR